MTVGPEASLVGLRAGDVNNEALRRALAAAGNVLVLYAGEFPRPKGHCKAQEKQSPVAQPAKPPRVVGRLRLRRRRARARKNLKGLRQIREYERSGFRPREVLLTPRVVSDSLHDLRDLRMRRRGGVSARLVDMLDTSQALLEGRGGQTLLRALFRNPSAGGPYVRAPNQIGGNRDRAGGQRLSADLFAVLFEIGPCPLVSLTGSLRQGFLGEVLRAGDVCGERFISDCFFGDVLIARSVWKRYGGRLRRRPRPGSSLFGLSLCGLSAPKSSARGSRALRTITGASESRFPGPGREAVSASDRHWFSARRYPITSVMRQVDPALEDRQQNRRAKRKSTGKPEEVQRETNRYPEVTSVHSGPVTNSHR